MAGIAILVVLAMLGVVVYVAAAKPCWKVLNDMGIKCTKWVCANNKCTATTDPPATATVYDSAAACWQAPSCATYDCDTTSNTCVANTSGTGTYPQDSTCGGKCVAAGPPATTTTWVCSNGACTSTTNPPATATTYTTAAACWQAPSCATYDCDTTRGTCVANTSGTGTYPQDSTCGGKCAAAGTMVYDPSSMTWNGTFKTTWSNITAQTGWVDVYDDAGNMIYSANVTPLSGGSTAAQTFVSGDTPVLPASVNWGSGKTTLIPSSFSTMTLGGGATAGSQTVSFA